MVGGLRTLEVYQEAHASTIVLLTPFGLESGIDLTRPLCKFGLGRGGRFSRWGHGLKLLILRSEAPDLGGSHFAMGSRQPGAPTFSPQLAYLPPQPLQGLLKPP